MESNIENLQKLISKDKMNSMGLIKKENGIYASCKEETLQLLWS